MAPDLSTVAGGVATIGSMNGIPFLRVPLTPASTDRGPLRSAPSEHEVGGSAPLRFEEPGQLLDEEAWKCGDPAGSSGLCVFNGFSWVGATGIEPVTSAV